ncbi:MAG: FHA domain-containing protein, partial [Bacteroidota bacterium]
KEFPVDIAIPHTGISRKHARIYLNKNQEVVLEDLNSTNGTYLNGIRVRKSYLQDGDVISFQKNKAEYVLELKMDQHLSSQYHPFRANLNPDTRQSLQELLAEKEEVTIGRKDCDIILANLSISRQHTSIRLLDNGQYEVRDLGSKNGTFINGEQIHQPQIIQEGDRIQIGRYEFLLQSAIYVKEEHTLNEDVIIAENINQILGKGSQRKIILNNISLRIAPGELVAIMGPSGSGKSSLLKALNGYLPATSGKVFIHGRDFYENYKLLKQDIGYVPQDDIVHQQLSVVDSLFLAAKLRFASDVSREEINQKIDEILDKLGILHIKKSLIKNISGGQRKRVSIAVELLSDPSILFLDEPTSPLDPETVEEFLKILKKLARSGTTILMVTHKPDDLDVADKVVF